MSALPQNMIAINHANTHRVAAAQLKASIRDGTTTPSSVFADGCPPCLANMMALTFVASMFQKGRRATNLTALNRVLLTEHNVNLAARLGSLTPRQLAVFVRACEVMLGTKRMPTRTRARALAELHDDTPAAAA